MANINNKLFAYTYAPINDAALLEQYKNSLIFIGKEQQIYQPLTNTYIGIGKSEFEALQREISEVTGNQLSEVVSYINKTNTGMITAQYSQNQFVGINGANPGKLGTYNSQLYQGSDLSTTSNEVVIRGANQFTGLNDDTITNLQNVFSKSGINVSIQRGTAYTTYVNPLNGEANVAYFETSYLTIDDAYTWSHIADERTYMTTFAQQVAVDQANRVYKNLMGINDNIYIEKQFNEAFSYNVVTGDITYLGGQVYIKNKSGEFHEVTLNAADNIISYNGTTLFKKDLSGNWRPLNNADGVTVDDYSDFSFTDGFGSMTYYNWDSSGDNSKEYVPVLYQLDTAYTAYSNINIVDGINTIKEIAYVLDIITDGADETGISLTYNIAYNYVEIEKLKEWKEDIGTSTVSSIKAESTGPTSNLITLTQYSEDHWGSGESTGNVVIDTKLNVAKVIPNRQYQKEKYDAFGNFDGTETAWADYAIYDPTLLSADEQFAYTYKWVYNPNYSDTTGTVKTSAEAGTTYAGGWFTGAGWSATVTAGNYTKDGKFLADGSDKVWVVKNVSGGTTINNVADLQACIIEEATLAEQATENYPYIYIPWSLPYAGAVTKDGVLDALTDVRWVTAYVNSTYELLSNRIKNSSGVTEAFLNSEFEKRTVAYTAGAGQYISYVGEENGYLQASYTNLPSDYLTEGVIVTTYNIKYVKATATEIKTNVDVFGNNAIYADNLITPIDPLTLKIGDNTTYYVKFDDGTNGFTAVTSPSSGTLDINKSIYVLEGNVYKPISIQEAIAGGGISSDLKTVSGTYYYAPNSSSNDRYLDANSFHVDADGSNRFRINAYITYVRNATETNTGLADAYDVRKTIEDMFTWIDLRTNAPFDPAA